MAMQTFMKPNGSIMFWANVENNPVKVRLFDQVFVRSKDECGTVYVLSEALEGATNTLV